MVRLIKAAIRNRRITLFAVFLTLVFGLYSYYITPKQESPDISVTMALITTVYPGASAQDVESLVTGKIEDRVMEIEGFMKVSSTSRDDISVVLLELETGADVDKAWNQLRQKMDELQADLPEDCGEIEMNTELNRTAGMVVSLSGKKYTYEELEKYAQELKDELIGIDGVSRIELLGEQDREACVEIDAVQLNRLPLSLGDITGIIRGQSVEIPIGALDSNNGKLNVKTEGGFSSLQDIDNTILLTSAENGSAVRLKDIATVRYQLEDSTYKIKHNGENAVLLAGYFKEERNIVLIGKEVDRGIEDFRKKLPGDVVFEKILYQPDDINKAVKKFAMNLVEGVAFVILVAFISMGLRNAVIASTSIPLSILLTLIGMRLFNIYIHQISITALIIALGMLVDNAIVVSDAIQVHIDEGQDKLKACTEGVREVAIPVLTSTMTTVGAFIPLLLLSGMAGEFVRSIPQIVIISLLSSYLIAMLVAPVMAYVFFKPSKTKKGKRHFRLFFEKVLKLALKKKKFAVAMIFPLISISIWLTGLLELQFFPKADTNRIIIDLEHEYGSDIEQTEALAEQVADILNEQQELIDYTVSIGSGLPKLYYSMTPPEKAKNFAQIAFRVDLEKGERFQSNEAFSDYLQKILDNRIAQGKATIKLLEQGEPIGAPIRLRVIGEREEIIQASKAIVDTLNRIPGTINVRDNHTDDSFHFLIDVDTDEALRHGISEYEIRKELNIALMGQNAGFIRNNKEGVGDSSQIPVRIVSNIANPDDIKLYAVKSPVTGQKMLMDQISEIGLQSGISNIQKYNRVTSITIYSDVKSGFGSVDIQKKLEESLHEMELGNMKVVFDGERESIFKYFGNIGVLAILAVFVIYLILLIQFRSFAQPFVIMATIPLSAIGSVIGLYLFGQPLSFTSLLGVVSLFGIVVNNAIVLVDFINTEKAMGKCTEEACMDAVEKRFRPVMLTTVTTLVGMIPLIFSGSNLFAPMSISLASGLAISTFLTLVMVPVVYVIVDNGKKKILS